jgi:hypothetical protein
LGEHGPGVTVGASSSEISMVNPVCGANGSSVCTHRSAGLLTRHRIGVTANVSTNPTACC